jgi:hypothetical protein
MWGDRYERPEGTGKAPMEPEATFMQVINDMLASQQTMSQSLAQVAERLAMVDIPGTQAPHAAQGNSGASSRPCCRLIHTWETWKKSSIHSVCPWGQVRVKVLSPNPQLLRLGQLLAKPRGVVPNKYTKAFKLSTKIEI